MIFNCLDDHRKIEFGSVRTQPHLSVDCTSGSKSGDHVINVPNLIELQTNEIDKILKFTYYISNSITYASFNIRS